MRQGFLNTLKHLPPSRKVPESKIEDELNRRQRRTLRAKERAAEKDVHAIGEKQVKKHPKET